jgi:hypothetical protein
MEDLYVVKIWQFDGECGRKKHNGHSPSFCILVESRLKQDHIKGRIHSSQEEQVWTIAAVSHIPLLWSGQIQHGERGYVKGFTL